MGIGSLLGRLLGGHAWVVSEQVEAQAQEPLDYPAQIALGDATLTLRLATAGDQEALLAFARQLPEHDLLFLRRAIPHPDHVRSWLELVEEGQYVTVLGLLGDDIVGIATVGREGLHWTRHVAELRVLVAESMRGRHLGRLLTEQAFALAKQLGVKKRVAQMTTDQRAAIAVFSRMGFRREARLSRHAIDRDGVLHDLQIMSLDVDAFRARLDVLSLGPPDPLVGTY